MVRDHIAQGPGLFVERRAVFDAHRFRRCDLHIVDVVPIPHWFEERIAKPEDEDVLHCLFAKIVVNSVDSFLVEYAAHNIVQSLRRFRVPPEGLFQNNSGPPMFTAVESYSSQTFNDGTRYRSGRRHIEQMIWARTMVLHF